MAQYTTGLVDTVAGSNVITGVVDANGDLPEWLTYLAAGDLIQIADDGVYREIASVDSDTQLTLAANYPTTENDAGYVAVTDFTANLSLPLVNQGDQDFADIYSRAMRLIDTAAQFGLTWQGEILDKDLTAPPGGESAGDAYIVGAGATGDWATHDGEIATYDGADWVFTVPETRDYVFVVDENKLYLYALAAWHEWTASTSSIVAGDLVIGGQVVITAARVLQNILQANVDNIRIDGNVISSTDTDGPITLTPNGSGVVNVSTSLQVAGTTRITNAGACAFETGSSIAGISLNTNIIFKNSATSGFDLRGGSTGNCGIIKLFGQTHATQPGDVEFLTGTTRRALIAGATGYVTINNRLGIGKSPSYALDILNGDIQLDSDADTTRTLWFNRNSLPIGHISTNAANLNVVADGNNDLNLISDGSQLAVTETAGIKISGGASGEKRFEIETNDANDDMRFQIYHAKVVTTDATETTIKSIALAADNVALVTAYITAVGSDANAYVIHCGFLNSGGTVSALGSVAKPLEHEGEAGWDATFQVSGGNILVRVTGAAATTIVWHARIEIQYHSNAN